MICLQNLSYSYAPDRGTVFDGLDLSIEPRSWVAVTGPDGSGKTTLCKLIKGLLKPDCGSIRLGSDISPVGTDFVGYLGGDPYDLTVGITVEEDVVFGMENMGIPPAEIHAGLVDALARTGLEGMNRRLVHKLSGGEQQKVALAGMMAMRVTVLVIDEALTMLDRPTRRAVRSLISDLRNHTGMTVVETSNNAEDLALADRVLYLSGGELVFDGTPREFQGSSLGIRWTSMSGGLNALKSALIEQGIVTAGRSGVPETVQTLANELKMVCGIARNRLR